MRMRLTMFSCLLLAACTVDKRDRVLAILFNDPPRQHGPQETAVNAASSVASVADAPVVVSKITSRHPPYVERACMRCHNMRSSSFRVPKDQLCFTCHDQDRFRDQFVHGPVAARHCWRCHDPHESEHEKLLRAEGTGLCLKCHRMDDLSTITEHASRQVCFECHDPHASPHRFLLREEYVNLTRGRG